jgi:Holliday junction resolvase
VTVNRYATAAGKKYESDLMKLLRGDGYDVERLRLSGAEDEGDLLLRTDDLRYVIEAKRTKSLDLAGWIKEAQVERMNYTEHRGMPPHAAGFVVVHYARNKGIGQSYVTTTLEEWLRHL